MDDSGRPASLKQIDDRFELDPKEVAQTIAKFVGKKRPYVDAVSSVFASLISRYDVVFKNLGRNIIEKMMVQLKK